MAIELSKVELDITKELVNIGLAKAADSLSFFVKSKVMLKGLNLFVKQLSEIDQLSNKKGEQIHMLSTQLKGETEGVCFLILDNTDVKKLMSEAIPTTDLNSEQGIEMKKAFLLELDNIISAAVVTQFSNILGKKMHGHVPRYEAIEESKLDNRLRSLIELDSHLLYFKVNFVTNNNELNPEFIWALDQSFIHGVKEFASSENTLQTSH